MNNSDNNTIPLIDCTFLRRGDYIELTQNYNPIPAGIYKFSEFDGLLMSLRIGQKVIFMLPVQSFHLLAKIKNKLKAKLTTAEEFADRYQTLLQLESRQMKPFDPDRGMTMCSMDPSLERRVH